MKHSVFVADLCMIGNQLGKNIDQFVEAGFDHVELMMDGPVWEDFPAHKNTLLAAMKRHPVTYSLHGPCYDINLTCENSTVRKACLETCLDAVSFAAESGCAHLVIHPGFRQLPAFDRDRAIGRSLEVLAALCERARETGAHLAIENVGFHEASLYTYEEYVHLLDDFGPEASYLLDIGHALINRWDCASLIRALSDRLCAIHLHDNDGLQDQHLPIGQGIAQWSGLYGEIAALPNPCSLVLEYRYGTPLSELAQSKKKLENALAAAKPQ